MPTTETTKPAKTTKKKKDTVPVVMDNPVQSELSDDLTSLCGDLLKVFGLRGIPGVLDYLEAEKDEELLQAAADRLKEGFNRTDLANMVLDRLKKIRLDIGAADVGSQVIGVVKQWLDVELTDAEVAEFSKISLEQAAQADEMEAAAQAVFKEAKDRVLGLRTSAKDNRKKALSRKDNRQIEVTKNWDATAQKVVLIRTDTGEEVGRRDATPQELQLPLFGG